MVAPNTPITISGKCQREWRVTEFSASAISAIMPPSPRLSARSTRLTYFRETIIVRPQKIRETMPSKLDVFSARPWVGSKMVLSVYSGLVPMSP